MARDPTAVTTVSEAATADYVRRAIELGREAAERGDSPYGSLLVDPADETVLFEERNAVVTDDDISRHPELTLARRAARELDADTRGRSIMYTSTEPCPMCAGGIAIAGLGCVVHSVSAERAASYADSDDALSSQEVYDRWGADVVSAGPVLAEEGIALYDDYR